MSLSSAGEGTSSRPEGLSRHADFMRLWGGQTVSQLGSAATDLGLPTLAVFQLGASAAQVGLLVACARLPFPILALPVGTVVDRISPAPRHDRRRHSVAAGCSH